jgi:MoxR-like ATPase
MYYKMDTSAIQRVEDTQGLQLGRDNPADYRPDAGLVDAVNVALTLNRPLLLTGDPGTGKTQLAFNLAWQLAGTKRLNVTSPTVERFEAKSTSVARDLFYSFDTLRRFQAAYGGGAPANNADYITFNALGLALINAVPEQLALGVLPHFPLHGGQRRSVVLIDEIDKAPRDFPNDLLNEIDQMFFRIPELENRTIGGTEMLHDDYRPIVIISSNSEKNLPDPFLRRCVYYHIPFPDRDALHEILLARLKTLHPGRLIDDALAFFYSLRENSVARYRTSPAELIQWLSFIITKGGRSEHSLKDQGPAALAGLSALVKDREDQERVRKELADFLGTPSAPSMHAT